MQTFFTPGPSQLFPDVSLYISEALDSQLLSISHRSKRYSEMQQQTTDSLRQLMDIPDEHQIFFVSSATEAMERTIENMVERRSHHFVSGAFAERFFATAVELGKQPAASRAPWGEGFDRQDMQIDADVELAAFTHNETSTGAMLDLSDIYDFKKNHADTLIALDVVSSAPICKLDFQYLDCVFFSVQKAFGLPAGLGVMIVSPAAMEKARRLAGKSLAGSYHSFISLEKSASKHQTPETPNVLGIYLLGRVAGAMNTHGIDNIRRDITERAARLYELIDHHKSLQAFVKDTRYRSPTVIVVEVADSRAVIDEITKHDLLVGDGYGKHKRGQIRIANFTATSDVDMTKLMRLIKSLD